MQPDQNNLGRVAIYARFSSDKQSDASIEDQVRRANELVSREGSTSVEIFSDFAISGASLKRPGIQALLKALNDRRFDTVVAESLDRISRDMEDSAHFRKCLARNKVSLRCLDGTDNGKSSALLFAVRAGMSEQYLTDLSDKTSRGLEGVARKGLSTGPLPYGYRSTDKIISIDPERAEVVRRIFSETAKGISRRKIAEGLNAEGVAAPNDVWSVSTVRVVLESTKYTGTWDYGYYGTDNRKHAPRFTTQRPELAIVDPEIFAVVKAQIANSKGKSYAPKARRGHLLSGIAKCALCGNNMISVGGNKNGSIYFGCSGSKRKGQCTNNKCVPIVTLTEGVLAKIRERIDACSDEIDLMVQQALSEWQTMQASAPDDRKRLQAEIAKIEQELTNLIDALAKTGSARIAEKIAKSESRVSELQKQLDDLKAPEPVKLSISDVSKRVRSMIDLVECSDVGEARQQLSNYLNNQTILCEPVEAGVRVSWALILDHGKLETKQCASTHCHESKFTIPCELLVEIEKRTPRKLFRGRRSDHVKINRA
jgi:DNA invertase Pin-like site-specific DNA recombinase